MSHKDICNCGNRCPYRNTEQCDICNFIFCELFDINCKNNNDCDTCKFYIGYLKNVDI